MGSAGVPLALLPHRPVLIHPATVEDAYGERLDYEVVNGATEVEIRAWLQQDVRNRIDVNGGIPFKARWLMVTDHADVRRRDRLRWTGPGGTIVFDFDGQPEPAFNPFNGTAVHHTEVNLIVVDG